MTDRNLERFHLSRPDGEYPTPNALVCVSLSEFYHNFAYKLAAAVIFR